MHTVSIEHLIDILHDRHGAQPVTIVTQTIPSMNKTNNPYYDANKKEFRVTKRSWVNGMIGWNYSNAVSRQREREGHEQPVFVAEPRKWGERIPHSPLVRHIKNGVEKFYLELKVERSVETPLYYLDGLLLDETIDEQRMRLNDIRKWIKEPRQAATQETEKEIILRDYALENILWIKVNGNDYRITL